MWKCNPNNLFPPQLALWSQHFIATTETLTQRPGWSWTHSFFPWVFLSSVWGGKYENFLSMLSLCYVQPQPCLDSQVQKLCLGQTRVSLWHQLSPDQDAFWRNTQDLLVTVTLAHGRDRKAKTSTGLTFPFIFNFSMQCLDLLICLNLSFDVYIFY